MGITFLNNHSLKELVDDIKKEFDKRIVDVEVEHYISSDNQDMFLAKIKFTQVGKDE